MESLLKQIKDAYEAFATDAALQLPAHALARLLSPSKNS